MRGRLPICIFMATAVFTKVPSTNGLLKINRRGLSERLVGLCNCFGFYNGLWDVHLIDFYFENLQLRAL